MTIFVDTNVLVYARDTTDPDRHRAALAWIDHLWETGTGRLSTQVLSEYYVTVTRKLDPGMSTDAARADIRDLSAWDPLPVDAGLVAVAFEVEDRAGLSYWDSLIVAAAGREGCSHLLTEDLNDGQTIDGVTIVDPFSHRPGELG